MDQKTKLRAKIFESYLDKLITNPVCELNFKSEFELLISVILSAQCTDKRVNKITENLFKKYSSPQDFANLEQKELEKLIFSCGFYTQKAKSIISASKDIQEKFLGKVPNNFEELTSLRGVGRKTANVVLSVAFNKPALAVDRHVFRVAKRLLLTKANNVFDCEKDLMKLFDKSHWSKIHYQMVLFGRYYCKARDNETWKKDFFEFEKNYLKENKME